MCQQCVTTLRSDKKMCYDFRSESSGLPVFCRFLSAFFIVLPSREDQYDILQEIITEDAIKVESKGNLSFY